jgi:hypothetical protein
MIGLYFGGAEFKTSFSGDFGNIELDANLDESHEWKAEATSNPVEEGAPITDHVIEQADKLRITGFMTETPIMSANLRTADSLTQAAFDTLRKLIKARQPLTVYTMYKVYTDMVMTSLDIPRTPAIGEAIEFSAEFVHIRKVATQVVDVPPGISSKKDAKAGGAAGSVAKKSEPKKDAGTKQPEPENESRARAAKELLKEILGIK